MAIKDCEGCGMRLTPENPLALCRSCAPATSFAATAPVKPADFWERAPIQAALRQRHIGRAIRAYRREHDPVLPQAVVGAWLGLSQGQISRIEHAKTPVCDLTKLDRWSRALHIPAQLLWFQQMPSKLHQYGDASNDFAIDGVAEDGEVMRRRDLPRAIAGSALLVAARQAAGDGKLRATTTARNRVGRSDVEFVREMAVTYRKLDNQFGGGHAQSALVTYLDNNVLTMLRDGHLSGEIERLLLHTVAELHHLAGWMAADVGQHGIADTYLREALRYAQASGDHSYTAEVLAGMSHQASYLGNGRHAIELAQAATLAARRAGLRSLSAEAAVMEAHGHALEGHVRLCADALRRAEHQFSAGEQEARPTWFQYFDQAYLSAKFGHVFLALGQARLAERYAIRSLRMCDGYNRGRLFNTVLLASIYAEQREVDKALSLGEQALGMVGDIRSVRTLNYLTKLARRLGNVDCNAPTAEFVRQVDGLSITGGP